MKLMFMHKIVAEAAEEMQKSHDLKTEFYRLTDQDMSVTVSTSGTSLKTPTNQER